MKIDDDVYVYMLVRYNKKTEEYRKCHVFCNQDWANIKCKMYNIKNAFPENTHFML